MLTAGAHKDEKKYDYQSEVSKSKTHNEQMTKRQRNTSKSVPIEANANVQKQEIPKNAKNQSQQRQTMHIKVNMIKPNSARMGEARRTEYDQSALEILKYLELIHQGRQVTNR
jgi:hypothetical protein